MMTSSGIRQTVNIVFSQANQLSLKSWNSWKLHEVLDQNQQLELISIFTDISKGFDKVTQRELDAESGQYKRTRMSTWSPDWLLAEKNAIC